MAVEQSTLWLQYLEQLNAAIKPKTGEALQLIHPFQPWNWGGESPPFGNYPYEQWAALNVVPSTPYLNSNTSPATQSGFDLGYEIWFNALAIGDLATDPHYKELQNAFKEASNKTAKEWAEVEAIWQNQTGGHGVELTKWLEEAKNKSYARRIEAAESEEAGLKTQLAEYQAGITSPVKSTREAFANPTYQSETIDPNGTKKGMQRIWATVPTTPWERVQEITEQKFGGPAVHGERERFTVESSSSQYDYSEYYAKGETGFWDDFIGAGGEGSVKQIEWSSFDEQYKLEFSFEDFLRVEVQPRPWYAGTAVNSFGAGPYAKGFARYSSEAQGGSHFFGPGGSLSRLYTALVVGYRPSVTITAGSEFASYLHKEWEAEGGLEIGPFFFGAKASGESTSSTSSVKGESIELKSTANWPVILGLVSGWTYPPPAEGS